MAHLWTLHEIHGWTPVPLEPARQHPLSSEVVLFCAEEDWLLLRPPGRRVLLNGGSLVLGLRFLRDRDEIVIRRERWFFSTEKLARIALLPESAGRGILCARCRQPVVPGTAMVCCPSCGAICHQREDLPCWAHVEGAVCPLCPQPAAFDAGFRWTPEEVWS